MPEKTSFEKQIIDAGFKALSKKHHPDKPDGSKETMQDLGIARENLRSLLKWQNDWKAGIRNTAPNMPDSVPETVNAQGQVIYNVDLNPFVDFVVDLLATPRRKGRKRK